MATMKKNGLTPMKPAPLRPGGLGKTPPKRTPTNVPTNGGKLPAGTTVKTPKVPGSTTGGRVPTGVPTMGGKLPTGTAMNTPKRSNLWITRGKKK